MAPSDKGKKGKKGGKKVVDPFARKEWFTVKAPAYFEKRNMGQIPANKTIGQRTVRENLIGRVIGSNLGDLNSKGDDFRTFTLKVDDVQGTQCLTSFHGMSTTLDKLRSIARKKQTLIDAFTDVKTTDGYVVRVFMIATTARRRNQQKVASYAQSGRVHLIRRRMVEVINKEVSSSDITQLIRKLTTEVMGRQVEKIAQSTYPIQNCIVRKVKVIRAPKSDLGRLVELHGGVEAIKQFEAQLELVGAAVERTEEEAAATTEEVEATA